MQITSALPFMNEQRVRNFWKKVDKTSDLGCWVWTSSTDGTKSGKYGVYLITVQAHRLSYELIKGTIPEGLVIDHLCRNRLCVNPNHLEAVTWAENIRRGFNHVGDNMRKTKCPKGHPLVLKHHPSKTERTCDICVAQHMRNRRLNKKILDGLNSLFTGVI